MSLRLLCDQCVPAEMAETLRRAGHTVVVLREVLPIRSPDPVVLAKAGELGALLVSLNGDFSDIVTYPPKNSAASSRFSCIIIRKLFPK